MMIAIEAFSIPLVLTLGSVVMMMQIAFWRQASASWVIGILTVIAAIVIGLRVGNQYLQIDLLIADPFSLFFSMLILIATLITIVLAKDYLQYRAGENEEFYLLLILSALGGIILVSSTHLASFLLGLELMGVALYALIAYPERGHLPLESAIKYLVLSGAVSAILLFGFALIYAALGTLSFAQIGSQLLSTSGEQNHSLILIGSAMIITGIGFKLSVVPFHMWTPDVYQGAPSPITGFLATVSKGAVFAALIRLYHEAGLASFDYLTQAIAIIAIASMLVGNLLALQQSNIKRLLAYSSIAHLGYLLITIVVFASVGMAAEATEAASFYLAAYIVTSLAAFSLLTIIANRTRESDTGAVDSVKGLFWRQPLLAILFMVALLSLAGIPLTAGFIGKFYLFSIGIADQQWALLTALVAGSGIGIYYYLKIIFSMSQSAEDMQTAAPLSLVAQAVIWALIALVLYLGVLPQTTMEHLGSIRL